MKFFLSAEYDFKTKTWMSGGRIIPNHAWAKSLKHELPFPVLNDQMMFLHNKNFWVTSARREIGPYNWDKTMSKMKKEEFSKQAIPARISGGILFSPDVNEISPANLIIANLD